MTKSLIRWVAPCATLVALLAAPSESAIVIEAEQNGTAVNNFIGIAQVLSASDFTLPVPPTVFNPPGLSTATIQGRGGDSDVDFYRFTTLGGTTLFDIDDVPFTFDTILSLFDVTGTLIAFDDDSFPADPGSSSALDSFIGQVNLAAGTYFIAVSQFANFAEALDSDTLSFANLTRPDGQFGGQTVSGAAFGNSNFFVNGAQVGTPYTLHISTSVVPEPASLALLSLGGVAFVGRKRLKRKS